MENRTLIDKSILLDIAFCIFFAIATNADWMVNTIVWWGAIALIFATQFIVYGGELNFYISKYKLWGALFLITCIISLMYSLFN